MTAEAAVASLLAQTPAAASARCADTIGRLLPDPSNIALFGAGNMGRSALARLRANGVVPRAFLDDTPSKQGTTIDGVPVVSLDEAVEVLGRDSVVVVTILNPRLTYRAAAGVLAANGLKSVSLMTLGWLFPRSFADLLNTAPPAEIVAHRSEIERCRTIWADEESRCTFDQQLLWRLTLDFDALPDPRLDDIYFPDDIELGLAADVTFVDAGAYDGDSAEQFIRHTNGRFRQIVAIEPDPGNFDALSERLARYIRSDRAACFNMGVGDDDCVRRFNASGDMSAAVDDAGDTSVQIKPLRAFFPADGPVYAKLDIEGAEWPALSSAQGLIADRRPTLAVSVYHDAADLWRIPLLIDGCAPGARLYLRAHGVDGTDVVLYAI